ncbi:MAG: hypothetical protein FWD82_07555, partial [Defluviitaleaceae bacterium]|nr:hypothetical protein [Defluviitaleaceae bacterium]
MTNTTLVLIVSIIAILVYIKVFVLDRKQKVDNGFEFENGMLAGNAQFIGNRDNQNDYFAILPNKNSIFAVIADGLNDKKVGKEAAVIAVEILKYNFLQELHKKTSVS